MTPVRSEQPVLRKSRDANMGNVPQPIFMSNIAPKPLFGSPPKVNTFVAKEEKVRLQVSGKSAASGLPRQLMGLSINLAD